MKYVRFIVVASLLVAGFGLLVAEPCTSILSVCAVKLAGVILVYLSSKLAGRAVDKNREEA